MAITTTPWGGVSGAVGGGGGYIGRPSDLEPRYIYEKRMFEERKQREIEEAIRKIQKAAPRAPGDTVTLGVDLASDTPDPLLLLLEDLQ